MSDNEPLDLTAIEARLAKITPCGWTYWWVDDEERFRLDLIEGDRFIAKKVWDEVDAQFIANAPTDIAALLRRVRELEALVYQQRKIIAKLDGSYYDELERFERIAAEAREDKE